MFTKDCVSTFSKFTEVVIIILSIISGSVTPGFHIIIVYVILTAGLITSVLLFVYLLLC